MPVLQLLHNNDGVRDVGGVTMEGAGVRGESVEVKGAQEREKEKLSGEVMHLREQLQHMQDECTQVQPWLQQDHHYHIGCVLSRWRLSALHCAIWWKKEMPSLPP